MNSQIRVTKILRPNGIPKNSTNSKKISPNFLCLSPTQYVKSVKKVEMAENFRKIKKIIRNQFDDPTIVLLYYIRMVHYTNGVYEITSTSPPNQFYNTQER